MALAVALALPLLLVACGSTVESGGQTTTSPGGAVASTGNPALSVPAPASVPGPAEEVDDEVATAVAALVADPSTPAPAPVVDRLAHSGDLRQAWILGDRLGFTSPDADVGAELWRALGVLTGATAPPGVDAWVFYQDLLAAWSVPAPPGYAEAKRALFSAHSPSWAALLAETGELDWRRLTWMVSTPGRFPAWTCRR